MIRRLLIVLGLFAVIAAACGHTLVKYTPQANPAAIQAVVVPRMVRTMAPRLAPSAMRIATSLVRCETRQETTLYIPAAAIAIASSAKVPMRNTSNRCSVNVSATNSSIVEMPKTAWSELEE